MIFKLSIASFIFFFCLSLFKYLSEVKYIYPIDLRNRVVGARLMNEKISPYYFKWHLSDSSTLYDPADYCNIKNNMITAPPSVLLLMEPLAKLDFTTICYTWMVVIYLFFLLTFLPIFFLFKDRTSKTIVAFTATLLVWTDYWNDFVLRGQNHFILPALISVILLLVHRKLRNRFLYIGILLSIVIWTRPNAMVIAPFAFFSQELNKRQYFGGLAIGALLLGALTLIFGQVHYWIDFYSSCSEWVKNNTSGMSLIRCALHRGYVEKNIVPLAHPLKLTCNNEDINSLLQAIFHINLKPVYFYGTFTIGFITALFISIKRPVKDLSEAILVGVLVYWFAEITTPVVKGSYYFIELFVVVLYLVGKWKELHWIERLLLAGTFVLAFLNPIKMYLYLGELCTITSLTIYLFRKIFKPSSPHDIPAQY